MPETAWTPSGSLYDSRRELVQLEQLRLQEEFTRLELALGTLQTTSQFLSRQLAQIAANSASIGAAKK